MPRKKKQTKPVPPLETPRASPGGWPPWWSLVLLGLVLAFLAVLKAYGINPALSDENIYFYFATRVVDGRLPYRDFSFAHPPIHLLWALPVAWVQPTILAFKLIPVVAVMVTTVAVYVVGRRLGSGRHGEWLGLLSALSVVLSHDVLRSSSHFTGVTEACACLAVGLAVLPWFPAVAGAIMGLGVGTALYVLPSMAGIAAVMALTRHAGTRRTLLGLGGVILAWNLLGLLVGGGSFIQDVYSYHLAKTEQEGGFANALLMVGYHQTPLVMAWLPSSLAMVFLRQKTGWRLQGDPQTFTWLCCLMGGVACVVFLSTQPRVFHFYLMPLLVLSAPLLALGLGSLWQGFSARAWGHALVMGLAFLLVYAVHDFALGSLKYVQRERGSVRHYTFAPAPGLGPINHVVRTVLWKDERVVGQDYLGLHYALWHESRRFEGAEALAADAARLLGPQQTLLGDSVAAPLVALMAHRRIANDQADTNTQRFLSGQERIDQVIAKAEQDNLGLVVVTAGKRFHSIPEVRAWLKDRFRKVASHPDDEYGVVELWMRTR